MWNCIMTLANGRSGLEGAVYLYLIHDCIILQKYENIFEKLITKTVYVP